MGSHSVALAAVLVKARVQVDQLHAPVNGMAQLAGLGGGDGFHQIAAGQDDVLELAVIPLGFFHAKRDQVRRSWH
jgi:hypothetical protein